MWGNQKKPENAASRATGAEKFFNESGAEARSGDLGGNERYEHRLRCDHWVRRRTVQPHGSDRASIFKGEISVTKIC